MTRCDGQIRDIEASARLFYDDEGRHVRRVGVNIDVTERKAAERRLSETQAELIHLSRLNSLGAMASSLGHELNQPLTAVANYVAAARTMVKRLGTAEAEPALEALQEALGSTLRAGELIRRLRLLSSKGGVKPQEVDLAQLLEDTASLALPAGGERITLEAAIEPDASRAYADAILLQQGDLQSAAQRRRGDERLGRPRGRANLACLGERDHDRRGRYRPGTGSGRGGEPFHCLRHHQGGWNGRGAVHLQDHRREERRPHLGREQGQRNRVQIHAPAQRRRRRPALTRRDGVGR
jgi:hypothetical protein